MAYEPNDWNCGDIVTAEKLNAIERGVVDMNAEYVPTEWVCGDTITAEKLNHIEQGIANGGGSSDFSTAKLTYSGNVLPTIYISRIYNNAVTPLIADAGTYDVVLYNGVAYGAVDTVDNVSVDGAIEYDDGDVTITGDCTITIS